jgi:hypothetical protein
MIILLFVSIILIWLHVYSLGFMIKTGTSSVRVKNLKKTKKIAIIKKDISHVPLLLMLFPFAVIMVLDLMEIGYFVYSNYIFNDLIVTIGSAILVGYTLHSMIKFLPKIKDLNSKPFGYLMERTQRYESVLNYIMVPLEIIFCSYIIVKVFIFY